MFWIQHGNELSPEDELFVGLDEGVASLIAFIKEHPCPHLGYQTAGDLPPDKGEYWKSAEMLKAIEAEGPATYLYYRTGLLSGVPDWIVWNLLTEEPEHFLPGSDKWTGKPWWPLGNARWTWERAATLTGMTRGPHAGINDDLRYR